MGLIAWYKALEAWSWLEDWRTWMAHALYCFVIGFLGAFLANRYEPGGAAAFYYLGREKLFEGGTYTTDRMMDALSAWFGAVVGVVVGWWLRGVVAW